MLADDSATRSRGLDGLDDIPDPGPSLSKDAAKHAIDRMREGFFVSPDPVLEAIIEPVVVAMAHGGSMRSNTPLLSPFSLDGGSAGARKADGFLVSFVASGWRPRTPTSGARFVTHRLQWVRSRQRASIGTAGATEA